MNTNSKSTNFLSALVTSLTFVVFTTLSGSVEAQSQTPLIKVTQDGNTITNNQFMPINYGKSMAYSNKKLSFNIENTSPNSVEIKSIKFVGTDDSKYSVYGGWESKTLGTGKSEVFEIVLLNRTAGIFSAIVSIEVSLGPEKKQSFKFPVTGKLAERGKGILPPSLYRTDLKQAGGTSGSWFYTIYKHKMDGKNKLEYYTSNRLNRNQSSNTNNIAIDTINNLMFWTETTSRNRKSNHSTKIMRGLMDNNGLIKGSVKEIEEIDFGTTAYTTISMGLTINPKDTHVYFSFSTGGMEPGPVQRVGYDGKDGINLQDTKTPTSSHVDLDKQGRFYYADGKKIKRTDKDFKNLKDFYENNNGTKDINGLSIDPIGETVYFIEGDGLYKSLVGDGNSVTDINKNLKGVTSIAYFRKEDRVYFTRFDGEDNTIGYIKVDNPKKINILQLGEIKMPSGGRLAIFPSMRVPKKAKITVIHGTIDNGDEINRNDNLVLKGYKVGGEYEETFTVKNDGSDELNIADIEIEKNSGDVEFSIPSHSIVKLKPFRSGKFNVKISQINKAGEFSATVKINPDGSNRPPAFSFTVSGTIEDHPSTPPVKVVIGNKKSDNELKNGSVIDMGTTPLKVNKPKAFGIYNPTQEPIIVDMSFDKVQKHFVLKNIPKEIKSGEVGTFDVVLTGVEEGTHTTGITIRSRNGKFEHTFKVKGEVTTDKSIAIYNVVTPNGDNVHDYLIITNITAYPNNKLTIFNRWGDKVYEVSGYNNNTKKFTGKSNVSGSIDLISGNYYYALDLGDGSKVMTGFLYLEKEN